MKHPEGLGFEEIVFWAGVFPIDPHVSLLNSFKFCNESDKDPEAQGNWCRAQSSHLPGTLLLPQGSLAYGFPQLLFPLVPAHWGLEGYFPNTHTAHFFRAFPPTSSTQRWLSGLCTPGILIIKRAWTRNPEVEFLRASFSVWACQGEPELWYGSLEASDIGCISLGFFWWFFLSGC